MHSPESLSRPGRRNTGDDATTSSDLDLFALLDFVEQREELGSCFSCGHLQSHQATIVPTSDGAVLVDRVRDLDDALFVPSLKKLCAGCRVATRIRLRRDFAAKWRHRNGRLPVHGGQRDQATEAGGPSRVRNHRVGEGEARGAVPAVRHSTQRGSSVNNKNNKSTSG